MGEALDVVAQLSGWLGRHHVLLVLDSVVSSWINTLLAGTSALQLLFSAMLSSSALTSTLRVPRSVVAHAWLVSVVVARHLLFLCIHYA